MIRQVLPVDEANAFKVLLHGGVDGFGKNGFPVFESFGVPNNDCVQCKIDILDSKAEAFHGPEAGAEKDFGHQLMDSGHGVDHPNGFSFGHNSWKSFGFFGANRTDLIREIDFKHFPVQEQKGVECLILGGRSNIEIDRQVSQKRFNFAFAHFFGVFFSVVQDVSLYPGSVGVFRADGVMTQTYKVAHLVQKLF